METNTQRLLNRARLQCQPPTWYQLSKRIGVADTTISRCFHHRGTLDNAACFRLAEFLGMEPASVIAYVEEDRAKTDGARDFWRGKLPRLLPAAALTLGLVTTLGSKHAAAGSNPVHDLYIMRTRHRRPAAHATGSLLARRFAA